MRTRLLIVAIALTVQGLAAQTAPILIDHHKPIRLRDGVTRLRRRLPAVGRGQVPDDRRPDAVWRAARGQRYSRPAHHAGPQRLRRRQHRRARALRERGRLGSVPARRQGRLRRRRVGSQTAVVDRQGRDAGRQLPRARAVGDARRTAAQPGGGVPGRRLDQPLRQLDHPWRRLPAGVQLRLGRGADAVSHHAAAALLHRPRCRCRSCATSRSSSTCRSRRWTSGPTTIRCATGATG